MKLLLDTHAFIWSLSEPGRLPITVRDAITNIENEVFVSSVSFWEISITDDIKNERKVGCVGN